MNAAVQILAGFGAGSALVAIGRGLAAVWDWTVYGRFEKQMEKQVEATDARRTALAARESSAANNPTPQVIRFCAPGWHPSCGVVMQVWSEPHPAAVAEQILRQATP